MTQAEKEQDNGKEKEKEREKEKEKEQQRGVKRPIAPPVISEPPQEQIQSNFIVVIHPGSRTLRIGRATDNLPVLVPHVIARRHKQSGQPRYEDAWLLRDGLNKPESKEQRQNGLKMVEQAIWSKKMSNGVRRTPVSAEQAKAYNCQIRPAVLDSSSRVKWTNTAHHPPHLVGEEALNVNPSDCYNIHWPVVRGQLNVHPGPGGSLTAVLSDLETIWSHVIQKSLEIPLKDLKYYRCILLVPDIYNRQHIKEVVNMLLLNMGFSAIIVHQESVCATFGSGLSSACVVDVGDQKTSVCCVEDGVSHRNSSVQYLKGTRILADEPYHCEYNQPLANKNETGPPQKWFHYLKRASHGHSTIQVANLPLPRSLGLSYKSVTIWIPRSTEASVTQTSSQVSSTSYARVGTTTSSLGIGRVAVTIFGGMAGLMILTSCYIIYKYCGTRKATPFGFKSLPQSPTAPVPVLVVYPAENAAFQQAVVALAEFLQLHGGCNVAIDMWQQGKVAGLGPMRWLAEQAKAADRVLIICPQHSSQPSHSPPDGSFPQPSIPAAAHDLYPLILNMVAGHAKSTSDLSKFWVVQLGKQQDKSLCRDVEVELRACKSFCLMKDLNKLCRSLHTQGQGNTKMSYLSSKAQVFYSEKNSVKLQEAVQKIFPRGGTTEKCDHVCLNI